jgi:probable phosphoglycerate mutase
VFSNGPDVHGLTQKGRAQADELADRLQGISLAALYCSPVLRAVQTAEIVGARLGIPHLVEDGLREYDVGILEGRTYDEAGERLYWEVVQQWMVAGNWEARIEGGESYQDIRARFMPLIRRLEGEGTEAGRNVLLISHGGTLRAMLPLLLSNVDHTFAMEQPLGYTTVVVAERRGREWVCLRWGEHAIEG